MLLTRAAQAKLFCKPLTTVAVHFHASSTNPIQLVHLWRNSICLSQISRQLSLQLIQFIIRIEERKYF